MKTDDDRDLAARFSALREDVRRAAPSFDAVMKHRARPPLRWPRYAFAALALAALVPAIVVMRDAPTVDPAESHLAREMPDIIPMQDEVVPFL